jgi:3-hydroxyisobutyrate dehydrogenase
MRTPENTKIGFVGIGVMGKSMAGHLVKAGYQLAVYNRTKEKARELIDGGAVWCSSPGEAAARSDVVITIVGFPNDVEEVYFGPDGILAHAKSGTVLIDMTTSDPALAVRIADAASKRGASALDAPVSGGDVGAREARLAIMVGGERAVFDEVSPIFGLMGKNIVYQGPPGSGQHCKMCNQIAIASGMLGVCEAIGYAYRAGLDPETVLSSISSGAAGSWSLSNLAPRMIAGNYAPGFFVKHFIKDMRIASASSDSLELDTPGLDLALRMYERLAAEGEGDSGTQALMKLYRKD